MAFIRQLAHLAAKLALHTARKKKVKNKKQKTKTNSHIVSKPAARWRKFNRPAIRWGTSPYYLQLAKRLTGGATQSDGDERQMAHVSVFFICSFFCVCTVCPWLLRAQPVYFTTKQKKKKKKKNRGKKKKEIKEAKQNPILYAHIAQRLSIYSR